MTSRGTPRPATNNDAPPGHDLVRVVEHALGQRGEQIDAERLVGERRARAAISRLELVGRHRRRAERAEAAGFRHRGDDRVIRDPAHPGEHHRVLDAEHLGQSCVHAPIVAGRAVRSISVLAWLRGTAPLVGVIMGSDSDLPVMQAAIDVLADVRRVRTRCAIVSAHRTPDVMIDYARSAADRGLRVIIAGAGGAAHLPGMTASMTPLPVIGVPVPLAAARRPRLAAVDRADARRRIPVATVAVGNARNAGLLAVRILATSDEKLRGRDGALPGRPRATGARQGRRRAGAVLARRLTSTGRLLAERSRRRTSSLRRAPRGEDRQRRTPRARRARRRSTSSCARRRRIERGEALVLQRLDDGPTEEQPDREAEHRAEQRDDHRLPPDRSIAPGGGPSRPRAAARSHACVRGSTTSTCWRCR